MLSKIFLQTILMLCKKIEQASIANKNGCIERVNLLSHLEEHDPDEISSKTWNNALRECTFSQCVHI